MAEFDGLDSRLRDAFAKAAEQGDSTGVADAIRSRIAAGDSGTSVAGSTAPGWGGGASSWMPWLGLIVVAGLVGGAVGVSGAAGRPAGDTIIDVPVAIGESAPAYSCVDGPVIGRIAANTRVLAVQRSDDSLWVGVRDPGAFGSTVWVALGDVSLDEGTPALETLPVGGACPETVVVVPTEEPTPVPTQEPEPEPGPGPGPAPGPSDTTAPSLLQAGVAGNGCGYQFQVVASDNVAVTAVLISWTGLDSGSNAPMFFSGGLWRYDYVAPVGVGNYSLTAVAWDAAGNPSPAFAFSRNGMGCIE